MASVPETGDAMVSDDARDRIRLNARDRLVSMKAVDASRRDVAKALEKVELTVAAEVNKSG